MPRLYPGHSFARHGKHALYHLAEKPEIVGSLRDEIEAAISADGWTGPIALGKMWKLDSFLREILRFHGVGLYSMGRMAMKDLTFSDGTRIPEGTLLNAQAYAMHHDDALLDSACTFDPFRFARMRSAEDQLQGVKYLCTSTSPEYVPFGHGPYACVGRYFAANELKTILAHVILNFDMKLGGDGLRPPDIYYLTAIMPAPRGCVLFKKRESPSSA
ncbi:cytochrome P450 [Ganoderma sinense ZZ0214-1]|uniref:Cytochrome P450 n=1 Tax=Ganoderma sinense ZZ0214-1 TaxID=1077348 RepID=A0A2G8S945_9APHY|nr:cytochrome P450 [Ganoderma sinense ZZ0214-1]